MLKFFVDLYFFKYIFRKGKNKIYSVSIFFIGSNNSGTGTKSGLGGIYFRDKFIIVHLLTGLSF